MLSKVIQKILITAMFIFLVNCGGSGKSDTDSNASSAPSSWIRDNSFVRFTSENIQYVRDGQKYVMTLKVEGCTDNLEYKLSRGDWKSFDIDPDIGEITFKKEPDSKIKKEYKFIAIVESCIDERDDLNITVIVIGEDDITPTPTPTPPPIITPTPTPTPTPIITPTPTPIITPTEIREDDYYITKWKTDNNGTSNNNQIVIPVKKYKNYNYTIYWGDGKSNENVTKEITHTYDSIGTYTIKIYGKFPQMVSYEYDSNRYVGDHGKLLSIEQWGTIKWESMEKAFLGCSNMIGNFTDTPDLSNVTDMSGMFYGAKKFNSSIDSWDTSNIIYMNRMFGGAESFNADIGSWDTSNVISMTRMFYGAKNFNQNITEWDISKVRNIDSIFAGAKKFNQKIGVWDVSNVTTMSRVFSFASNFNQPLNSWDVSEVKFMDWMFSDATKFNQDIGNWDTSNVEYMSGMFHNAESFNQDISSWNVSKVIETQTAS